MNTCTPSYMKTTSKKSERLLWGAFISCIVLIGINLAFGASALPSDTLSALLRGDTAHAGVRVLLYVRLPRTMGAAFAGFALASAGVLIQKVLGNPLAGPNLIGINAGAGFGATLALAVFPALTAILPVFAFLGALLAALTVAAIARRTRASRVTVILAGAALGTAFSAASDTLHTFFPNAVAGSVSYRIGSLDAVSVKILIPACILIVLAFFCAFLFRPELDVLSLGDDTAGALGIAVGRYRFLFLVLAAALSGAAVSFAGLLGFVGLLIPHAARRLIGEETEKLLPLSGFLGAGLVLLCELPARLLVRPYELPVGIFLSALGVPFFLWLLLSGKGGGSFDD